MWIYIWHFKNIQIQVFLNILHKIKKMRRKTLFIFYSLAKNKKFYFLFLNNCKSRWLQCDYHHLPLTIYFEWIYFSFNNKKTTTATKHTQIARSNQEYYIKKKQIHICKILPTQIQVLFFCFTNKQLIKSFKFLLPGEMKEKKI